MKFLRFEGIRLLRCALAGARRLVSGLQLPAPAHSPDPKPVVNLLSRVRLRRKTTWRIARSSNSRPSDLHHLNCYRILNCCNCNT
jgi:hypothetical protein